MHNTQKIRAQVLRSATWVLKKFNLTARFFFFEASKVHIQKFYGKTATWS
jgi:hypothetical protein